MRLSWKSGRTRAEYAVCALLLLSATRLAAADSWEVETVDAAGAGKFSSLKFDNAGNAHLAFVSEDGHESVKYGFWDHVLNRWFIMKIAEGGSFTSLALDSKGRPRISWADSGTVVGSKLRYAYWDGAAWKKQTIPLPADTIAYYTSLVVDADDNPSISYYEYDGPKGSNFRVRMRVVTSNGQYWQVSTADSDNQSGKFNSMAIDAQGRLHLAYANVNAGTAGARYAVRTGSSWHTEVIDGLGQNADGYVGHGIYIVLDREGNPHITYLGTSDNSVRYAVRRNGRWAIQIIDRLAGVGYPDRNSMALDGEGRPYIAYFDAGQGSLKVARQEGDKWLVATVDTNGSGFTSAMQINRGTLWIAYADEGSGSLKVARVPLSAVRGTSTSHEGSDAANRQAR
jgi:hypothetical protein